jgi:hypothetical protein
MFAPILAVHVGSNDQHSVIETYYNESRYLGTTHPSIDNQCFDYIFGSRQYQAIPCEQIHAPRTQRGNKKAVHVVQMVSCMYGPVKRLVSRQQLHKPALRNVYAYASFLYFPEGLKLECGVRQCRLEGRRHGSDPDIFALRCTCWDLSRG